MRKRGERISTVSDHSSSALVSEPPSWPDDESSWPDDEPEDDRSSTQKLLDQLIPTVVGPLRELLRFDPPSYAREHYQAHEDDSTEDLLIKLVEARDDPFVSSADRKRLRRFSLRPYFLRQRVSPRPKRPGPRATLTRRDWRALGDVREELTALFQKSGPKRITATEIAAVLDTHLPEHRERWANAAATYADDDALTKPYLCTRRALGHFLGLSRSMIDRGIGRVLRPR